MYTANWFAISGLIYHCTDCTVVTTRRASTRWIAHKHSTRWLAHKHTGECLAEGSNNEQAGGEGHKLLQYCQSALISHMMNSLMPRSCPEKGSGDIQQDPWSLGISDQPTTLYPYGDIHGVQCLYCFDTLIIISGSQSHNEYFMKHEVPAEGQQTIFRRCGAGVCA